METGIEPYQVFKVSKAGKFINTYGEPIEINEPGWHWQDVYGDVSGPYSNKNTAVAEANLAGIRDAMSKYRIGVVVTVEVDAPDVFDANVLSNALVMKIKDAIKNDFHAEIGQILPYNLSVEKFPHSKE